MRCRAAFCAEPQHVGMQPMQPMQGCMDGVMARAHPTLPTEPLVHADIPLKSCLVVFQAVAAFIRCWQTAGPNYNTN